MRERVFRTIAWILIGIASFFMGYYNQEIQTFFFNKNALIGMLSAALVFFVLYCRFLQDKNLKQKLYHENDKDELRRYRDRDYSKTAIANKIDGLKGEIKGRYEDLHKSLSLRDDIFKKVTNDLSTQISNMKHDIMQKITKTK